MSSAAWRLANKEHISAYGARYRADNGDRLATWRTGHKEQIAATHKAWLAANRERNAAVQKVSDARRHRRIRDRVRARSDQRRRGLVVVESVSRAVVFLRDGARCGICGWGPLNPTRWHLDHVIPVARGGTHSYANVQASHPSCNWGKGAGRDT